MLRFPGRAATEHRPRASAGRRVADGHDPHEHRRPDVGGGERDRGRGRLRRVRPRRAECLQRGIYDPWGWW